MILRKKGWVCLWGGRCNWPSVTAVFPAERPCTVAAIANNRWPVRSCNSIVLTGCRRTGLDRAPHTPVSQRYCSYRLGHFCSTIRRNRNRVRDTMGALHRCTRPVDAPRTLHPRRRRRNHAPRSKTGSLHGRSARITTTRQLLRSLCCCTPSIPHQDAET